MLASLYNESSLTSYFSNEIKENGSFVSINKCFYCEGDNLKNDIIVNIKVDDFYNGLKISPTPPSADILVVVKGRSDDRFDIYVIELKDVRKMGSLNTKNIIDKFKTTIHDFISSRYDYIFLNKDFTICNLNLWVVCNRFSVSANDEISDEKHRERIKDTAMGTLLLAKPIKFGHRLFPLQLKDSNTCEIL